MHRVLISMASISETNQAALTDIHPDVAGEPVVHEVLCGHQVWCMLPARWCDTMRNMKPLGFNDFVRKNEVGAHEF